MYVKPTLLSPKEAAIELWGVYNSGTKKRIYRMLGDGAFNEIADKNNCPIIKDGNRFRIPRALIKALRGET